MVIPPVDYPAVAGRAERLVRYPSSEWEAVAHEATPARDLLLGYGLPLMAIPVVAKFLGSLLFGAAAHAGTVRPGFFQALLVAALHLSLWVGIVQACALLAARLAPGFGGRDDLPAATRLAVHAMTPVWIAGAFLLIPPLAFLCIGGLYGAWLGYVGAPVLMRVPRDQAAAYAAIVAGAGATMCFLALALVSGLSR